MRFNRLRRFVHRLLDRTHNTIAVGRGSVCTIPPEASVSESVVKVNGESKLILEPGAQVSNASFQIDTGSTVRISTGTVLTGVDICVWNQAELSIGKDCRMDNVCLAVEKGKVEIADNNVLSSGGRTDKPAYTVAGGTLSIGDHNHLQNAVWVRFGGVLSIGRYNCINAGSSIRCDESVQIGSFNMISYDCDIWDTNTHCFYTLEQKKKMFEIDFPFIGRERNKPKTSPVVIGDGNWIGKNACILKGSTLGNETVVGTRAIVSNMLVEDGAKVTPAKSEII